MSKAHQPTLAGDADLALDDFEQSLAVTTARRTDVAVTTARRTDDAGGGGKKGRPKGSPNREVDQVEAPATACTKCGSTRREPYFNKRVIETAGIDPKTGQGYTAIVYRRTICSDCGQFRDDRTLVNEPKRQR
jgi:hypothetical protein